VMLSQPQVVIDVIRKAVKALGEQRQQPKKTEPASFFGGCTHRQKLSRGSRHSWWTAKCHMFQTASLSPR